MLARPSKDASSLSSNVQPGVAVDVLLSHGGEVGGLQAVALDKGRTHEAEADKAVNSRNVEVAQAFHTLAAKRAQHVLLSLRQPDCFHGALSLFYLD